MIDPRLYLGLDTSDLQAPFAGAQWAWACLTSSHTASHVLDRSLITHVGLNCLRLLSANLRELFRPNTAGQPTCIPVVSMRRVWYGAMRKVVRCYEEGGTVL